MIKAENGRLGELAKKAGKGGEKGGGARKRRMMKTGSSKRSIATG